MNLDEFKEIYNSNGEVCATLLISDIDCDLDEFASEFPELARYFPANGFVWCLLLCRKPELKFFCDWSIFDSSCLVYMVVYRPEFSLYCDWSIIDDVGWMSILLHHPSFHIHCDSSKLNNNQWRELLIKQPKLQSKFDAIIHDTI